MYSRVGFSKFNSALSVSSFYRETASIPLIPLGLKETKDVDFSIPLKVGFFHSVKTNVFLSYQAYSQVAFKAFLSGNGK